MAALLAKPDGHMTELSHAPALPRLDPAAARALSALYRSGAEPVVELAGTRWRLQWRVPSHGVCQQESFGFRLGPHAGVLRVDRPAVGVLLNEREADRLPVELRCVLWADALHPLAEALSRATRLHFEWSGPGEENDAAADEPPAHAAHFRLSAPGTGGFYEGSVAFADARALASVLALLPPLRVPRGTPAWCDGLRVPVPFKLGSTAIRLAEMARIRPGDIVAIDEWASSGPAIVVTAEIGGPGGGSWLALAEGRQITVQQTKESAMDRDTPAAPTLPDNPDAAPLPLDRLDAMEVTLRFEVGDLSLTLGELKTVRAGHVFELAQPLNRSPVRVIAHGNVLGKGYLVAVGDRLGVRVSEFAPGEI
jgi:type III secretion protein Q